MANEQIVVMQFTGKQITRLGEILVRQRLISDLQLVQVLAKQPFTNKKLGELLVAQRIITAEQLEKNLANQRIMLGNVLIQKKLITWKQLHRVLPKHSETKRCLGQLLVEAGYISGGQLESALEEQYWRQNGYWVID